MKLGIFLEVSGPITKKGNNTFSVMVPDQMIYKIGQAVPLIKEGEGCAGLAKIFEYHVSQHGTSVFFQLFDINKVMAEKIYEYYCIVNGTFRTKVDKDTVNTGMTAAARMMMGESRSARQIGRDARPLAIPTLMMTMMKILGFSRLCVKAIPTILFFGKIKLGWNVGKFLSFDRYHKSKGGSIMSKKLGKAGAVAAIVGGAVAGAVGGFGAATLATAIADRKNVVDTEDENLDTMADKITESDVAQTADNIASGNADPSGFQV